MISQSAITAFQLQSTIVYHPLVVDPHTKVADAITQMNQVIQSDIANCSTRLAKGDAAPASCILVMENQQLLGILTASDVVRLLVQDVNLHSTPIKQVMTSPVIALCEEVFIDLGTAIDILHQNHMRHLPLLDRQQQLIGLLTRESLQQRSHPNELWREQVSKLQQELAKVYAGNEILQKNNQDLILNNEEIARVLRLKDEFLTNMSHELRTPLNAIIGMTEGLQEGIFGETNAAQTESIDTIEKSSNHLLELINDILDLAKIGAGQVELNCEPTNIQDLCQASLAFVKQQALEKRIRLKVELPAYLPAISLDERRIRQVLINLLNNAVKFTPVGGAIALHVTIESDNTTASVIRLNVIDTGIGINSTNLVNLFQPFIQVDSALNRQYQGTGLGLSLVKKIIELHGGHITVHSEVGVGSQFVIDLPIKETIGEYCDLVTRPLLPSGSLTPRSADQPWTVLLAEDNEANIRSISGYLMAKGYHTILAKNGIEAVSFAQSQLPDIILMDIQMPKMDGLEAMRQIRSNPQIAHIPIIALTALAMQGDREKCLGAGASDYLTKPVALKQLASKIHRMLEAELLAP
jgi:signal transduction histidine kinase/ActR/RegA family two-component response regulator